MEELTEDAPLLSVVTVTYNLKKAQRAAHFRACVESVHALLYPNIEHLVIDGASSDGTRELIAEYEEKGWLTCFSEPDKGIYDAMNKGLARACGKYIAFLNSDDLWHDPHGISLSMRLLEETQADFSFAPRRMISESGEPLREEMPEMDRFYACMPFCHQTMLSRTDLLREMGGFRQGLYQSAADYDLLLRMILRGCKPIYVPLTFTSFRLGGFSNLDKDAEFRSNRESWSIRLSCLGPYMTPEDSLENVMQGIASDEFWTCLRQICHPAVAALLPKPLLVGSLLRITRYFGPFGLQMLRLRRKNGDLLVSFFGLRVLRNKTKVKPEYTDRCYKLFCFLPFWRHRRWRNGQYRHYLFSCIPVFGKTETVSY